MAVSADLIITLGRLERFRQKIEAGQLTTGQVAQILAEALTDYSTTTETQQALGAALEDYMTAADVQQAIATLASSALTREIVSELPEPGDAAENVIYMMPAGDGGEDDIFDEYLFIGGAAEKIGSTRVDLTGYLTVNDLATDADIDALFE